eukprot:493003-Hanusia_phi.AAC.1
MLCGSACPTSVPPPPPPSFHSHPLLRSGTNPLSRQEGERNTPMHSAAYLGNSDIIHLLARFGADVNARSSSLLTPLHYAATWAHRSAVLLLLRLGADPLLKETRNFTALDQVLFSRFAPEPHQSVSHGEERRIGGGGGGKERIYAELAEVLRKEMKKRLNGSDPVISTPPHFRHGNLSAREE